MLRPEVETLGLNMCVLWGCLLGEFLGPVGSEVQEWLGCCSARLWAGLMNRDLLVSLCEASVGIRWSGVWLPVGLWSQEAKPQLVWERGTGREEALKYGLPCERVREQPWIPRE